MSDVDASGDASVLLIDPSTCDSTYTPQALLMLIEELIRKNVEMGEFKPGQITVKVVGDQVILTDHSRSREFKVKQMMAQHLQSQIKIEAPIADGNNPNSFNRASRRGNKSIGREQMRDWRKK